MSSYEESKMSSYEESKMSSYDKDETYSLPEKVDYEQSYGANSSTCENEFETDGILTRSRYLNNKNVKCKELFELVSNRIH